MKKVVRQPTRSSYSSDRPGFLANKLNNKLTQMLAKVIFAFVVLTSCGIIYGVHYQRQQERLFMRRVVIKELEELKRSGKLPGKNPERNISKETVESSE